MVETSFQILPGLTIEERARQIIKSGCYCLDPEKFMVCQYCYVVAQLRQLAIEEAQRRAEVQTSAPPDGSCCAKATALALNTPEILDFLQGVKIEAAHQLERWKATDPSKADVDWFWTLGWLAGKAVHNVHDEDDKRTLVDRRRHRLIAAAALLYNWHQACAPGSDALSTSGKAINTEVK